MRALLRAELIKLRTTRTFAALAIVAVATSLLITGLTAGFGEPTERSVLWDIFTNDTASLFVLILAVVGISGEWRHRTITSSLLAAPDRLRFLSAKTLAFAAAGVALSLAIAVTSVPLGLYILSARELPTPETGELLAQLGRNAILAGLLGALGVGIGGLLRNQPIAIVVILMTTFVFEPALIALEPDVGRYGPFFSLPIALQDIPAEETGFESFDLLAPALAGLALLAWIAIAFAAAGALLSARDVE